MVPCATNFDADAKEDNGECEYPSPTGAVTSVLMNNYMIDFETGKIDSIYPCNAGYEYDLLVSLEQTQSTHLYFSMNFPHKAKGDTACKGVVLDNFGNALDKGGSSALISTSPYAEDQNWKTCEQSTKGNSTRTIALAAQKYFVLSVRDGKRYKIYIDNIIYNGSTPWGVKVTWVAMQK
ncbi:MAG: hypothetical protein A3H98_03310 [Bacteroidetes bacterium RIFCSPLOWO2_02_FULL_36_8]|nr:MAG: hypothetical protein A3H98_03310 [Bacteroidetes bacterium RIFCSPLOWO2_02_FULL_36_8]OFY71858.1 MAG: hypothetical protein A3G23_04855 [Bacteroidetes bacterium RIFCSPLOWO2_12_FULL_37_12]